MRMRNRTTRRAVVAAAWLVVLASGAVLAAAPAAEPKALENLPIKEVTAFKDGHAFVLHEGAMPTDDAGRVVLDYLPAPVLGTFWPYAADPKTKLTAVVAGKRRVSVERTALTIAALVEGNVGAKVRVSEKPAKDEAAPALRGDDRRRPGPQRRGTRPHQPAGRRGAAPPEGRRRPPQDGRRGQGRPGREDRKRDLRR